LLDPRRHLPSIDGRIPTRCSRCPLWLTVLKGATSWQPFRPSRILMSRSPGPPYGFSAADLECGDLSPLSAGDSSPSYWSKVCLLAIGQALNAPWLADKSASQKRRQVSALQKSRQPLNRYGPPGRAIPFQAFGPRHFAGRDLISAAADKIAGSWRIDGKTCFLFSGPVPRFARFWRVLPFLRPFLPAGIGGAKPRLRLTI